MRMIYHGLIGRHWYRVDVDVRDRWVLTRCHDDPRDNDTVAQGWTLSTSDAEILQDVSDELKAIAEVIIEGI